MIYLLKYLPLSYSRSIYFNKLVWVQATLQNAANLTFLKCVSYKY